MKPSRLRRSQSPRARKRWAIVAAAAMLVVGGCAMYLSWGIWGVFVACSSVTLVGSVAPALVLVPRPAVTRMLVMQVASCAMWFMLIGWGLVALLYPDYTVGWKFPGKGGGGLRIEDADDAPLVGGIVLGTGIACAALIVTVEIIPRIRGTRSKQ